MVIIIIRWGEKDEEVEFSGTIPISRFTFKTTFICASQRQEEEEEELKRAGEGDSEIEWEGDKIGCVTDWLCWWRCR